MAFSRYKTDGKINLGQQLGTPFSVLRLRTEIKRGTVPIISRILLTSGDRLDTLAGQIYGEAKYWWILAAASDIGWGLQVPPGTIINIVDVKDAERLFV